VEFERALEIRPDFCGTYQHLIDAVLMEGRPELGEPIIDQAAEHCGDRMASRLRCSLAIWSDFVSGDSETIWSDDREECRNELGNYNFLLHRTAITTGRLKIAQRTERGLKLGIEAAEMAEHIRLDFPRALLHHMEGTRLLAAGAYEDAVEAFTKADDKLLYWGEGQGVLKLYNQMNLARAYERADQPEAAEKVLARVRAVNPSFAALYPYTLGGL
jgi:tetratricopeptide (TPR) repeat protein